mgnify:CR=1 FL=1|tara:strand:+ start:7326 stop:7832 length:507 start_codon:yes stop_codon:yes gene_type:complete
MSKCPYTNFRKKVMGWINILRTPTKEYSNYPPCPFVGPEVDRNKLMIELFDPEKNSLLDMMNKFVNSEYDSALFIQKTDELLLSKDTYKYQNFINRLLKKSGFEKYKCICFNPNDITEVDGLNIRSKSPYFLINVADRKVLSKAHKSLLRTKYFDNMGDKYKKYLKVK